MASVERMASGESAKAKRPVSDKQVRANRRNAGKATGPRSDPGKARASRNALRHGMFAAEVLLPGEDAAALRELQQGIFRALSPQDELERELAERVVAAQWRLRRARGAERAALTPEWRQPGERTTAERALDRAAREAQRANLLGLFDKYGWEPGPAGEAAVDAVVEQDHAPRPQSAPEIALARDFGFMGTGVVERLGRYAQRLEQSVHRAMRELRQLRKDRHAADELPPCPYLDETQDSDADDESTADESAAPVGGDDRGHDETCGKMPSAPNVRNEPICEPSHAASDAAGGCETPADDRAARSAPWVMHPHPVRSLARRQGGDRSD